MMPALRIAVLIVAAMLWPGRFAPVIPVGPFQAVAQEPPGGRPSDFVTVILLLLGRAGVDFSDPGVREWLADREFTPYPAFADALLILTDGKALRRPVYLDVIAWNYEHGEGAPSPRDVSDVDFELLRAAVVTSYNERYGEAVSDFSALLEG